MCKISVLDKFCLKISKINTWAFENNAGLVVVCKTQNKRPNLLIYSEKRQMFTSAKITSQIP